MATEDRYIEFDRIAQGGERYSGRMAAVPYASRVEHPLSAPHVEAEAHPVKSDVRKSKAFQAFLASEEELSEVYRRLAES